MKKRERTMDEAAGDSRVQGFLDMIAPSVIQFNTDHFICGNTYRCVWALREYPTSTEVRKRMQLLQLLDFLYLHFLMNRTVSLYQHDILFRNLLCYITSQIFIRDK